jgi:HAMP domain-containing protein
MAVASVLAGLALVTLVAKFVIERRLEAESRELEAARSLADSLDHKNVEGAVA